MWTINRIACHALKSPKDRKLKVILENFERLPQWLFV
jgi:hypothetical protein